MSALHTTYQDLTNTLTGTAALVNKPRFLSDVLAIKKDRGDSDCLYFSTSARMLQSRLGATVEGAHRTAVRNKMTRFAEMLEEFI